MSPHAGLDRFFCGGDLFVVGLSPSSPCQFSQALWIIPGREARPRTLTAPILCIISALSLSILNAVAAWKIMQTSKAADWLPFGESVGYIKLLSPGSGQRRKTQTERGGWLMISTQCLNEFSFALIFVRNRYVQNEYSVFSHIFGQNIKLFSSKCPTFYQLGPMLNIGQKTNICTNTNIRNFNKKSCFV